MRYDMYIYIYIYVIRRLKVKGTVFAFKLYASFAEKRLRPWPPAMIPPQVKPTLNGRNTKLFPVTILYVSSPPS